MTLRRAALPVSVLACLLWVTPAMAEPSAADRDTARTLMDEADAKLASGDVSGALKAYQAAHGIMNVPVTGIALAKAQAASGLLVEARETCLSVGRMPPVPSEPPPFKKARSECAALVPVVEPKIPSIRIVLSGPPEGADTKVTVDGAALATGAWLVPRKVNPGKHTVAASATGFASASRDVAVAEGATQDVPLTLVKSAASVAPVPVQPGPIVAPPSTPSPLPPPPAREKGTTSPLVYAGFGVAAVGLGVGTVAGVFELSKASKAKQGCVGTVCPTANQSDIDAARSLGTVSTIGFALGLVGVGVGVLGLTMGGSKEPSANAVRVSPGPGSVWVDGRF